MKKLLSIFTLMLATLSVSAASTRTTNPERSNLYEKVPMEGSYVGYVSIETNSPGYFGVGGFNGGITTAHGKMVTRNIFLGLGTGYIADFAKGKGVIPVFADFRYFFQSQFQRRIYPHIGLRGGATVATIGKAGGLAQAAIGFRVPLSEKLALNLEVGPQYSSFFDQEVIVGSPNYSTDGKWKSAGARFSFFGRLSIEF